MRRCHRRRIGVFPVRNRPRSAVDGTASRNGERNRSQKGTSRSRDAQAAKGLPVARGTARLLVALAARPYKATPQKQLRKR